MTTPRKRKKKAWWIKVCVVVVVVVLASSTILLSAPNKVKADRIPLTLFYTISIPENGPTFHIHINIHGLLKGTFLLHLFNGKTEHNEKYIKNLQAKQGEQQIMVVYKGELTWKLVQKGGQIDIDYDVDKIIPVSDKSKDVDVYINPEKDCGAINGLSAFLVPSNHYGYYASSIKVKFEFPKNNWILICPYIPLGDNIYEVPHITRDLTVDFAQRRGIYFGRMKFYSQEKAGNCIVKYGILEADERTYVKMFITNQEDLNYNVHLVAKAITALTEIFGDNPYPVMPISDTIIVDGWRYTDGAGIIGGNQYWPPDRYDETISHLIYSWSRDVFNSPAGSDPLICKGIGEYLGNKLAYELTGDKSYLGKLYYYYLVLEASTGTKYFYKKEIHDEYYRGAVLGAFIDQVILKETNGKKSLDVVIKRLYQKYKNSGHKISVEDLEAAIDEITGKSNTKLYKKYIEGDEAIPIDTQIYKENFSKFIEKLNSKSWGKDYHNHVIPFFIDIEISIRRSIHLPFSILVLSHYNDFAKEIIIIENYQIDNLTKQNIIDTLNKLSGTSDCSDFFEKWSNVYGKVTLDEIKDWLKSYLPYTPQNTTASFNGDTITLNWSQVQQRYLSGYYRIIGYNIYRGTKSGDEKKLTTVTSSQYIDSDIEMGKTYYYYITTIEDQPFGDGIHIESEPSQEIKVVCKDTTPPIITVTTPNDFETVNSNTIIVSGVVTDDLSGIREITVNGNNIPISSTGSFNTVVTLIKKGENKININAIDKTGNETTKTITVIYKPQIVITLKPGDPYMTVDGVKKEIDPGRGTKPVIIPKWSRTVVPIRAIVEALGGTISWDGMERKVTINFNGTTIELWIDNPKAKVNGAAKWIDENNHDVKPIIINSRTMLPLRFIAESLGCRVDWDAATRTITIIR